MFTIDSTTYMLPQKTGKDFDIKVLPKKFLREIFLLQYNKIFTKGLHLESNYPSMWIIPKRKILPLELKYRTNESFFEKGTEQMSLEGVNLDEKALTFIIEISQLSNHKCTIHKNCCSK